MRCGGRVRDVGAIRHISKFYAVSESSHYGLNTPETEGGLGCLDIVIPHPSQTLEGSAGTTSGSTCQGQTGEDGNGYQGFDGRKVFGQKHIHSYSEKSGLLW
jgi:hypothetical protein